MNPFHYKDNQLFCENVPVERVAEETGTPFYLYSRSYLLDRFHAYERGFGNHPSMICFAVKSNSNLAVINTLAEVGAGADIVSGGELFRALRAGVPADRIVYSGVGKKPEEIRYALDAGILMFNVESMEELAAISDIAHGAGKKAGIAIRVNPDVDAGTHPYISTGLKKNKFGLSVEQAEAAYMKAKGLPGIEIRGIDCHIGSQLVDSTPFMDAFSRVRRLLERLETNGISIDYIDIGGGLGIRYRDETPPSPDEYIEAILQLAQGLSQTIIVEPGRSISGNAGILVTKVLYTKDNGSKQFVVVDAAMNDLGRPSLYGSWHDILPVRETGDDTITADIVGPICETGDFLARDREIPAFRQGDLMAVMSAGAYGFTMSSNYNTRPRVAEVMAEGGEFRVVRKRETLEDMVANESIAVW
jgi:diaminopimelate decarboxylase